MAFQQPDSASYSSVTAGVTTLRADARGLSLTTTFLLSILLHVGIIGGTALIMAILQFFGFDIKFFNPLEIKPRDIEFVLVDTPTAPPKNKNTKLRAERATRTGGEKVNKVAPGVTTTKAGTPKPQPKPQPSPKPASKPTPKPQQQQPTKTTPSPKPTPPKPQAPSPSPSKQPPPKAAVLPPNPIAPTIKTPAAPNPNLIAAGPIVQTPQTSTGTGSGGGAPQPSQIPGALTSAKFTNMNRGGSGSGGNGSPGGQAGQGGSSSSSQFGSPGGGGGAPGIDALPEPDYGAYMAELQRRIKRNWRPPTAKEDKRVVLFFKIGRDGRLLGASVKRSSGYPDADQAALNAVRVSAPFRQLPAGHRDNSLDIEFTFDYNVYTSQR